MQISGYSDKWMLNNVYDMAGNLAELSDEKYNDDIIVRGGFYHDDGSKVNIGYRTAEDPNKEYVNIGFRVIMILK